MIEIYNLRKEIDDNETKLIVDIKSDEKRIDSENSM